MAAISFLPWKTDVSETFLGTIFSTCILLNYVCATQFASFKRAFSSRTSSYKQLVTVDVVAVGWYSKWLVNPYMAIVRRLSTFKKSKRHIKNIYHMLIASCEYYAIATCVFHPPLPPCHCHTHKTFQNYWPFNSWAQAANSTIFQGMAPLLMCTYSTMEGWPWFDYSWTTRESCLDQTLQEIF